MFIRIRRWLAPPRFEGDEEKRNAAALLNTILWIAIVGPMLFVGSMFVIGESSATLTHWIVGLIIVISLGLLVLLRAGYVRPVGIILMSVLLFSFAIPMLQFGGVHDSAVTGLFVVIVMAGIIFGRPGLFVFSGLSTLTIVITYIAENAGWIEPDVPLPTKPNDLVLILLTLLTMAILLQYALQKLTEAYTRARRDAQALAETNAELAASRDALATQTAELERRSRHLEATAEVVREASSVLDLERLLDRVVALITEHFELFRLGIFLLEPESEWAVLRAASGGGGQQLMAQDFRIRVDGEGVVARVIRSGQLHLSQDVSQDPLYLDLEDVADTRSELTLPLRARGEVLGALSVQSPETDGFDTQHVATMQTLADQVALAISNIQLFQQAQESLEAERRAYGELSREAWRELVRARPDVAVLRDEAGISSLPTWLDAEVEQALETGRSVTSGDGARNLAVPIRVRGHVVGAIDAHKPEGAGEWTSEQIVLLEAITDQLANALESARLYQDTQQRAAREELLSTVATRIRQTLDLDTVLQTAIHEIGDALDITEVEVRLGEGSLGGDGHGRAGEVQP